MTSMGELGADVEAEVRIRTVSGRSIDAVIERGAIEEMLKCVSINDARVLHVVRSPRKSYYVNFDNVEYIEVIE